jgi:hypothetical protein
MTAFEPEEIVGGDEVFAVQKKEYSPALLVGLFQPFLSRFNPGSPS